MHVCAGNDHTVLIEIVPLSYYGPKNNIIDNNNNNIYYEVIIF